MYHLFKQVDVGAFDLVLGCDNYGGNHWNLFVSFSLCFSDVASPICSSLIHKSRLDTLGMVIITLLFEEVMRNLFAFSKGCLAKIWKDFISKSSGRVCAASRENQEKLEVGLRLNKSKK